MEVKGPSFRLREARCPCICGGEGLLVFITCPGCDYVTVACDEVGTLFHGPPDLRDVPGGSWLGRDSQGTCPKCRKVTVEAFRPSTGEEIQALGFTPAEYT
jgi:hypothetical protein